jgi:hypothetical protein
MSVLTVRRRPQREASDETQRNGLLYEIYGRRYKMEFNAYTSTFRDTARTVLDSPLVPALGSSYSEYLTTDVVATCTNRVCKATDNFKIWRVECTFDTDRVVNAITDNPLNQPPEISWDFSDYERPMIRDAFGTPVLSSSKNPFDPPVMYSQKKPILRIVRNESTYDPAAAFFYSNSLNAVSFAGVDPLYAKMNSIPGHRSVANGIIFYQITYEIEFHPISHVVYILDQDFRNIRGELYRDELTREPLTNPTPQNGRGYSMFKSKSTLVSSIDDNDTSMQIALGDVDKFPPELRSAISGIIPGPYWNFKLAIEDEAVEVVGGHGTDTFTITRGVDGTTPAAHAADTEVKLEPYFLRYIPEPGPRDWTSLALPVI